MKEKLIILSCLLLSALAVKAQTYYYVCKDRAFQKVEITDGAALPADWTDIDSVTFSEPQFPSEPILTDGDTVDIIYNSLSASVMIPEKYKDLVTASISGADVTLNSSAADEEIVYRLSGTSSSASFLFYGSYKATFVLAGVNITSSSSAAMNIQCGKRIAIELAEGTDNYLTDAAGGDQKACLYVKGHTEFSKGGTLTVSGKTKHAISSKEYVLVKKTVGKICLAEALGDGIHAGQYFKMNGGEVEIQNAVMGDGIQAEVTNDETDEQNGQMIIQGGTITINIKGDYSKCLKADSLFTMTDGVLNLTNAGKSGEKPADEGEGQTSDEPTYKLYVSVPTSQGGGGGGPMGGGTSAYYWNQDKVYLYTSSGTLVATITDKVGITVGSTTTNFFCYDFGKSVSPTISRVTITSRVGEEAPIT